MEGMTWQPEALCQPHVPTGLDEFQITLLGWAIDFVTHHGMTGMGKVNPDLVGLAGVWDAVDEGDGTSSRMV